MQAMKAVRIHAFGGADMLRLDDVPIPAPNDNEVLIRVHAASVNPVDYKTRAGKFPLVTRANLPFTLGRDVSGVVEKCGKSVGYCKPGDLVYALLDHQRGSHAEYVAAASESCTLKPSNLEHVEAAALPLVALTAYQGLFEHARLQAEQRVLIHGGAGGVGHLAIQLAKAKGARICTTCSADDMEFVSELGADEAVDYQAERFEDTLEPVDVVLDLIGGETQERSWKLLKKGGALISTLSEPSKEKAHQLGARVALFLTHPSAAQLAEIARLAETDEVRPRIAATFPLAQVADAYAQLETTHTRGKVVLVVRER